MNVFSLMLATVCIQHIKLSLRKVQNKYKHVHKKQIPLTKQLKIKRFEVTILFRAWKT